MTATMGGWHPRDGRPPLFGLDRSVPARRFIAPLPPRPWWRRACTRIGLWFLRIGEGP